MYDVTKFLDDHPGGGNLLLGVAGKDASEKFDDNDHSMDAREMTKDYLIGELEGHVQEEPPGLWESAKKLLSFK